MINLKTDSFAVKDETSGEYKKFVAIKGDKGEGVPTGGNKGQALMKNSSEDYDVSWGDVTVDQIYNASSENAQSGLAVAEALKSAGKVDDVKVNGVSVVTDKVANITTYNPIIKVISNSEDTITCTDGTTIYTKTGTEVEFEVYYGTWTITNGSCTRTQVVDSVITYEVKMQTIFGVKRLLTSTSPSWIRTNDSASFNATASIGSSVGSSDFDNYYPYNGIERKILSTNDVMVKIPKFYYKRYNDGTYEYIQIADSEGNGFTLHPAFDREDGERDYIYVGAYKTSSNNCSLSGKSPQVSQTRVTMRTNAKAKGSNWGIIDFATTSAIQMLILVEFATYDVQTAIGAGYSNASAALSTGTCDTVANLTGRPSGTSNVVDVVWRGIEGYWGNVWEWTDGLNWNGGIYYACTNPSKYADDTTTGYTALSYTGSTSWSGSYIQAIGLDTSNSWAMMPSAAGSGSSSTYVCDGIWSSTGWRVFSRGGSWGSGTLGGLFASGVGSASSDTSTVRGSRLLYLPF